ncbi:phage/plasmid primase, P4 family [Streptomyces sp. NPDC044984]|uniref:DNA primase family protein n=1 Tax=Streptomyces sp. NPDC044984 TaxID=3154335 RepID=UPI0033DA953B
MTFDPEVFKSLPPDMVNAIVAMHNANTIGDDFEGDSDDDLARALFDHMGGNVRFDRSTGWAIFREDGHAWQWHPNGLIVEQAAQEFIREYRMKVRDRMSSHEYRQLGSRARRDAVVAMLRTLPGVLAFGQEWDANPDVLACANGVVDLRTGKLSEGRPEDLITRSVGIEYDPNATCPRWLRFLSEVFPGDPELPAYVQRFVGYGITGHTREQVFAVLYGEGSNGKSVFLNTIRCLFSEHAVTVPFDMFTGNGAKRGGAEAELLRGARLALASEINRGAILDSAAIKNATGGEEINVNPKYRDPYSFKPQALILLATNYRPDIRDQDHGIWRRVKLLPFERKFEAHERDYGLEDTLRAEFPGILAWAVRGAMEWYAHGLGNTPSVVAATKEYREESDPLAGFFPGVLVADPTAETSSSVIWTAYQEWAEDNGIPPFKSSKTLTTALKERDGSLVPFRSAKARGLRGVRLADDSKPDGPGVFQRDDASE